MKRLITFVLLCLSISVANAWTPDKSKPITIVTGFGPGGNTHLVATWFQQFLESKGYNAIVDIKPGAKGQIATTHFAKQANNGHNVLVTLGLGMLVHPQHEAITNNKPSYKDFELVTMVGKVPSFLITRSDNTVKNVNTLTLTPKKKISIAYATETQEILAKTLQKTLPHDVVIVPYKNSGDVMRDLLGGTIDYAVTTYTAFGTFAQQGKITLLASTVSNNNFPEFDSKINTLGKDFGALNGIVLPKNTPKPVVDFYLEVTKEFVRVYKTKFDEVHLYTSDNWYGPKEFLKELLFLESLI